MLHCRTLQIANATFFSEASQKLLEVERWSPGGNNLPSATFKLSSVLSDGETIMNEANLLQALGQVSACETGKIFRLNKGVSGRSRSGKRSKNRDSAFGKGSRAGHGEHSGRGASRTRSIESRPNLQACGGCSDEQRFRENERETKNDWRPKFGSSHALHGNAGSHSMESCDQSFLYSMAGQRQAKEVGADRSDAKVLNDPQSPS